MNVEIVKLSQLQYLLLNSIEDIGDENYINMAEQNREIFDKLISNGILVDNMNKDSISAITTMDIAKTIFGKRMRVENLEIDGLGRKRDFSRKYRDDRDDRDDRDEKKDRRREDSTAKTKFIEKIRRWCSEIPDKAFSSPQKELVYMVAIKNNIYEDIRSAF